MKNFSEPVFKEKLSKYLIELMEKIGKEKGLESLEYKALYNQYCYTQNEENCKMESNLKHYEAAVNRDDMPKQIERLYKRQAVVELTMVCAAHCRYCLRSNYEKIQLQKKDIAKIVNYLVEDKNLREILITGGDPFLVPQLLMHLISEISEKAPNIKIVRIGTRLPVQDPERFDEELFNFFKSYSQILRFECAIQINHPVELQDKACDVIQKLDRSGVRIYSQNVLLKGVNDEVKTLVELYDKLRYLGVEAHYLFHPVPIQRTSHFRMPIKDALSLIKELTASGHISGRIKPMLAVMTDIGKVVLYDGSLQSKDAKGYYTIKTAYKLEDRLLWNPNYRLPESASIDEDGYITVKYLDGGM